MKNYLFFNNGTEDSVSLPLDMLTAVSAGNDTVTFAFGHKENSGTLHEVVLACANGVSSDLARTLIDRISVKVNDRIPTVTVADDTNSVYLDTRITGVTSIVVTANTNASFKQVVTGAFSSNDIAVTNAMSGSIITVPTTGATSTITLPAAPKDGFNARFVCEADNGAHTITVAGEFEGIVLDGGTAVDVGTSGNAGGDQAVQLDGTTSMVIAASKFKIGDFFEVVYAGSAGKYKVFGMFKSDAAVSAS
jgi:hypothetical protein